MWSSLFSLVPTVCTRSTRMSVDANAYNDSNKPQINDAIQLINTLLKIYPKK